MAKDELTLDEARTDLEINLELVGVPEDEISRLVDTYIQTLERETESKADPATVLAAAKRVESGEYRLLQAISGNNSTAQEIIANGEFTNYALSTNGASDDLDTYLTLARQAFEGVCGWHIGPDQIAMYESITTLQDALGIAPSTGIVDLVAREGAKYALFTPPHREALEQLAETGTLSAESEQVCKRGGYDGHNLRDLRRYSGHVRNAFAALGLKAPQDRVSQGRRVLQIPGETMTTLQGIVLELYSK
jgi:hypothetical protein